MNTNHANHTNNTNHTNGKPSQETPLSPQNEYAPVVLTDWRSVSKGKTVSSFVKQHRNDEGSSELERWLARCGKSCRLQWMNYLKPGVKRGNYSKEEEHLITKLHHELGNKWSAIARKLPGRTDNEIKNYWHTHLKKRTQGVNVCYNSSELGFNNVPSPVNWDSEDTAASSSTSRSGMCEKVGVVAETSNSGFEFLQNERERSLGSFWTQQFLVDTDSYIQPYETTFPVLSDEIGFFSGYESFHMR
ncbi:hypothetical protein ACS0TY_022936 [Phlomoides rotata]